ncbi:hypothetical protein NDU88_005914 [Pleurodeles waltl]|uniref:Uncharacterized protein n=1 Tax=Pleurodeles waltl TaxID=8319 RepID=A0AAV7QGJ3_PLEWA|nr:hypothetical protein NDU88_005914 [Pleurodeles waltl]
MTQSPKKDLQTTSLPKKRPEAELAARDADHRSDRGLQWGRRWPPRRQDLKFQTAIALVQLSYTYVFKHLCDLCPLILARLLRPSK